MNDCRQSWWHRILTYYWVLLSESIIIWCQIVVEHDEYQSREILSESQRKASGNQRNMKTVFQWMDSGDRVYPIVTRTDKNLEKAAVGYSYWVPSSNFLYFPAGSVSEPIYFLEVFVWNLRNTTSGIIDQSSDSFRQSSPASWQLSDSFKCDIMNSL